MSPCERVYQPPAQARSAQALFDGDGEDLAFDAAVEDDREGPDGLRLLLAEDGARAPERFDLAGAVEPLFAEKAESGVVDSSRDRGFGHETWPVTEWVRGRRTLPQPTSHCIAC